MTAHGNTSLRIDYIDSINGSSIDGFTIYR
jgi:hypothetical protein